MPRSFRQILLLCVIALGVGDSVHARMESSPSAYDRFWYRSSYPYRKNSRLKKAIPLYLGVTNAQSGQGTASGLSFAGGIGFDFWYGRRSYTLGFDLLIVNKKFEASGTTFSATYLQIPLVLRLRPTRWLSFHGGVFASPFSLSGTQTTGTTTSSASFSSELGFTVGLQLSKRLRYRVRWILDLRYDLGLTNVNGNHKLRTMMALGGVEFRL